MVYPEFYSFLAYTKQPTKHPKNFEKTTIPPHTKQKTNIHNQPHKRIHYK